MERGLCPGEPDWFDVLGYENLDPLIDDFLLPSRNIFSERLASLLTERISRFFSPRPTLLPDVCTGCGKCAEICPRKAIAVRDGLARIDLIKCIRCFCCEELCEYGAIGITRRRFPLGFFR